MKIFKSSLVVVICLFAFFPYQIQGGVNLKNGNFYISYQDIRIPGGAQDLKITRTFNSKSIHVGWFGIGWGTPFETRLEVLPDGSAVIHENGSGAQTRFSPRRPDPKAIERAAEKIIAAMRKKGTVSEAYAKQQMKKLKKSASLRQQYAKKFNIQTTLRRGTVLQSNVRGLQKLHKTNEGYKRVFGDGKVEFFDNNGKLLKIQGRTGYVIDLKYKKGHLVSIKDSTGKQIFFDWYESGRVKNIWAAGKRKVSYRYDGKALIESNDVAGNTYKYGYDGNFNMTSITYQDRTKMLMDYYSKTQFVKMVTGRDGRMTKYRYKSNPKNRDRHYWTLVTKIDPKSKKKPITNRYEYEIRLRTDGSEYTYRVKTRVNGLTTETTYSECCGLPLMIQQGKTKTTFEYNDKGLLTKKVSSDGTFSRIQYHPTLDKITRVENNQGWTTFKYNKKGKLIEANNSQKMTFALGYDIKERIKKVVYTNKKGKKETLTFRYNSQNKPNKISMKGVGEMEVSYNNQGEVRRVKSKKGAQIADRVTRTFLSLLTVVRPAGVNLTI